MAPAKKNVKKGSGLATEIGAGVLAAAAAGAGYYFYGDKNAKKHRSAAAKWAKDMKKQVDKEVKIAAKLDKKVVANIVDRAMAAYAGVKSVKREDLMQAASELKANWKQVAGEVEKSASKGAKTIARPVKKAVSAAKAAKATPKKVAKKAPAKKK